MSCHAGSNAVSTWCSPKRRGLVSVWHEETTGGGRGATDLQGCRGVEEGRQQKAQHCIAWFVVLGDGVLIARAQLVMAVIPGVILVPAPTENIDSSSYQCSVDL